LTVERSDRDLVRDSRRGDKEAFRELVERYQRKILSVALGMVHNRDDALELTQETFVKAFENLGFRNEFVHQDYAMLQDGHTLDVAELVLHMVDHSGEF